MPSVPTSVRAFGAVLCTVAVVAATLVATSSIERTAANRGYQRTQTSQALLTTMLDRETGLRGFLQTNDRTFLASYAGGTRSFQAAVRAARGYAGEVPSAELQLKIQIAQARRWEALARAAIVEVRRVGVHHLSLREAFARKRAMDTFRAANTRYLAAMNARRISDLGHATMVSTWIVVALSLLLALGGLLLVRLNARRERREREALRAVELLVSLRNLASAERRAHTDSLTGLPNRRALDDTFEHLIAQAKRAGEPLSVMLIDLDLFKEINDTYGHDRGDEVLAAVASALAESVRTSDFAARMGGEEFLVLLPDTDAAGAGTVAETIAEALAGASVEGVERRVTASFGVACHPDHGADPATLLRSADRALYRAKDDGRACVRFATEPAYRDERPEPARAKALR